MARAGTGPTVGVVVMAYHRTEFLERALRSVAASQDRPDRVVVVEDNPPYDRSSAALLERVLPGIPSVCLNRRFEPVGGLLVVGVENCPTDVVAFLEDDDLFLPEKIGRLRARYAEHPEVGYLRHCFQSVDTELARIPLRRSILAVPQGVLPPDPRAWARARPGGNCSSISFRREPCRTHLAELGELTAVLDMAMFWLALRSDVVPFCEASVLTLKTIHLDSTTWRSFIYGRQRDSLQYLVSRSRPGSNEQRYAAGMLAKLLPLPSDGGSRSWLRDTGLRFLALLQQRLPRRPASWVRRASLMVILGFSW